MGFVQYETAAGNCTSSYGVTDVFDSYPPLLLYFAAFCFVVFITVGIPGNAVTVLALGRCKKVHSATVAFIINLSIADFLFCVVNLPLAVSNFLNRGWVHGEFLCIVSPFLRYGNVAVALMTVMAITLNRFMTIVHPHLYPRIFHRAAIASMIAAIWAVSFGPLLPTLAGWWGRFGFDRRVGTCTIIALDERSPKAFLFVVAFVVPCVIICLCYLRIFCVVRLTRAKAQSYGSSGDVHSVASSSGQARWPAPPALLRPPAQPKDPLARAGGRNKGAGGGPGRHGDQRDLRLVKMILVIFGSFLVCNLPLTLVKVLGKEEDMPVLNTFGYIALYATSCTNPVIYVAMSREYRRAYLDLFTCGGGDAASVSYSSAEVSDASRSQSANR